MDKLLAGARALGLQLTRDQQAAFQLYYEELVAWNQKFNLTAITDYEQVQIRHLLDSLSCLSAPEVRSILRQPASRILDVGTGAGFPGIPLKIICPATHMTLIEATGKKVRFLERLVTHLDLKNTYPLQGRAEELAHDIHHREQYHLVLARAVAELAVLVEYTLPFCRVGGWVIAQKGEAGSAEAWNAERAIHLLGGTLCRIQALELPGLPEERSLVIIEKTHPTPEKYPRRPGIPSKRPLG